MLPNRGHYGLIVSGLQKYIIFLYYQKNFAIVSYK